MARIARLRVLETLADSGGIQSYRVVDTADGSKLIAHYGDLSLFDVADKLGQNVLERGESGGKLYLLTPDRPEFENLNASSKPTSAVPEMGEFTRMFKVPIAEPPPPPPPPEKKAPSGEFTGAFRSAFGATEEPTVETPVPAIPAAPPAPEPELGFTGMFSAVSRISAESQPIERPKPASVLPEPTVKKELPPRSVPAPVSGEFTSFFKAPPAPPKPEAKAPGDNDFTRMFQAPTPPPQVPLATDPPQPQRARPLDGEFTRIFQAQTAKAPPAPPIAPPAPPPTAEEPGAFTRMFQAPPVPTGPPKVTLPPKPESIHDSGEFTRFFQNPLPQSREPDWKAVEQRSSPPPAAKPEGDFTRMFGKPGGSGTPAAPPPSSGEGATDLFKAPKSVPAPPAAASKGIKDDFSKQFGASAAAAPPQVTLPQAAPVLPVQMMAKKPPILILLVIIAALLVLAGCALYYFVIKPK